MEESSQVGFGLCFLTCKRGQTWGHRVQSLPGASGTTAHREFPCVTYRWTYDDDSVPKRSQRARHCGALITS